MKRSHVNLPLVLMPCGALPLILAALLLILAALLYLNDVRALYIFNIDIEITKFISIYSVIILTFISGLEWGIAILLNANSKTASLSAISKSILIWSNFIIFLALLTMLIPKFAVQIAVLTILFITQLVVDIKISKFYTVPYWFAKMRLTGTIMIVCPLIVLLLVMV